MPLEDEYCRIKNEADVLVIDMPISSFKYRAIFLLQNEGYGILCIMCFMGKTQNGKVYFLIPNLSIKKSLFGNVKIMNDCRK